MAAATEREDNMQAKGIFGTVIASVLLVLYVYLVAAAVWAVVCTPSSSCKAAFNDEMGSALLLLGGLVAAPVIAELAVTKPNQVPAQRLLVLNEGDPAPRWLKALVGAYFVLWLLSGLTAVFVGWRFPQESEALSTLGKTWLGLAVAAGYAYFGVTPPAAPITRQGKA